MRNPLVRAAFAAIAVATVAAFFVAQQLKSEFPLVLRFAARPAAISPNHDGYQDRTRVGFDLTERARISFSILDSEGREVRRVLNSRVLAGDRKYRFSWDARDSSGRIVPDGIYRMRVVRRDQGRVIDSIKKIRVDTRPPAVRLFSARPGVIAPAVADRRPRVVIRYAGPRNFAPEFRVFRTDDGPPRVVLRFRGDSHRRAVWDGYVRGHPAVDGDYAFTARVRDRAGNTTVAPSDVPTDATAAPGTGVAVRSLTLRGPLGVVRAGSVVRLRVGPFARRFAFALSRLRAGRRLRAGSRVGGAFRLRVPRRARTGLYAVRVRAGGRRAAWPLAVTGPPARRAAARRRPLVVLPLLSWQGLTPVDDDLDGFADTLDRSRAVRLDRPFARGRLPPRLRSEAAPLTSFLDRERLSYDLTTDLALARGDGPKLGAAPGVALAGSERWAPPALGRLLEGYVRDGGRLASFGADSLRRMARLGPGRLSAPSRPSAEDAFGERAALLRAPEAPLAIERDRIGLFRGVDPLFGSFSIFELSERLPPGARRLAAAGRDPGRPALVAYRLGRGTVVRLGSPQWSRELEKSRRDVGVARVTKRLWRLLGSG
ncbi:MAG: N,N-dimethylformamidase beta subunit family domain-containing protein [Thermoleophilaceae bacterium]